MNANARIPEYSNGSSSAFGDSGIRGFTCTPRPHLTQHSALSTQHFPPLSAIIPTMSGGIVTFTLIFMMLLLGAVTVCAIVLSMAVAILKPPRMTDGKAVWVLHRLSPGDLGLGFEEVTFDIRDEQTGEPLRIAGWWIAHPAADGKCVVLLHGYADAKVGVVAWAPLWHALGFNILAIDLRAHGESGGSVSTAGFWERHDVNQVLNRIRAEREPQTRKLVLFGVSVGAAVATATAALRDDLAAVVLESPPADFRLSAMRHMDRLGAPGPLFQRLALSLAERLAHCDFAQVRPVDLIAKIRGPLMIVSPLEDPLVSDDDRAAIRQSLESRRKK